MAVGVSEIETMEIILYLKRSKKSILGWCDKTVFCYSC